MAGRAHEAIHQPDSTIAQYEAYFTDPPIANLIDLDAIFLFDTLERLGRLYEARGDSAQAVDRYMCRKPLEGRRSRALGEGPAAA